LSSEEPSDSFALVVQLKGPLSVAQLERAMMKAVNRHPGLVKDLAEDTAPGMFPFPFRTVECSEEADWAQEVEKEFLIPFPRKGGPFARFIWLKHKHTDDSEILAVFNHSMADGFFGVYLLRDTLNCLAEPGLELPPFPPVSGFKDLLPPSLRKNMRLALMTRLYLTVFKAMTIVTPFVKKKDSNSARETAPGDTEWHVSSWLLDEMLTRAFVARCRAEATTVHAALCVAFSHAIASQQSNPSLGWKRKVLTPVNMRRYFSPAHTETLGVFSVAVEVPIAYEIPGDFWEAARVVKQRLGREIRPHKVLPLMWTLKQIAENPASELALEGLVGDSGVTYDFVLTNLGRLDFPLQYGDLKVQAVYGPVVRPGMPGEKIISVATVGERMYFAFTAGKSSMQQVEMAQIAQLAMAFLNQAITEGEGE